MACPPRRSRGEERTCGERRQRPQPLACSRPHLLISAASPPHPQESRICVCVRKRPMLSVERARHDFDVVTCEEDHASLVCHEPKTKVAPRPPPRHSSPQPPCTLRLLASPRPHLRRWIWSRGWTTIGSPSMRSSLRRTPTPRSDLAQISPRSRLQPRLPPPLPSPQACLSLSGARHAAEAAAATCPGRGPRDGLCLWPDGLRRVRLPTTASHP